MFWHLTHVDRLLISYQAINFYRVALLTEFFSSELTKFFFNVVFLSCVNNSVSETIDKISRIAQSLMVCIFRESYMLVQHGVCFVCFLGTLILKISIYICI